MSIGSIFVVTIFGILLTGVDQGSDMSELLKRIGRNVVRKVPSMEEVPLESLWAENPVVITFFRRFG